MINVTVVPFTHNNGAAFCTSRFVKLSRPFAYGALGLLWGEYVHMLVNLSNNVGFDYWLRLDDITIDLVAWEYTFKHVNPISDVYSLYLPYVRIE